MERPETRFLGKKLGFRTGIEMTGRVEILEGARPGGYVTGFFSFFARSVPLPSGNYYLVLDLASEARACLDGQSSDAHGHYDVAVLIFAAVFRGAQLSGRLGVFEFNAHLAGV